MSIRIIPHMRKDTSTLLTISATAIVLLLLASPPVFFNLLLQPTHAQTTMTFKTPEPAKWKDGNNALTFDAQGTLSTNSSGYQSMNGTFQIKSLSDGSTINSGDINRGRLYNNSQGVVSIELVSRITAIDTSCSTSATNIILVDEDPYLGAVDCDLGGDTTTAQPSPSSSSPITGTKQDRSSDSGGSNSDSRDSDSDGIPDSSDRCTHTSNPRCFKEGATNTTSTASATNQQQR